MNKNNCLKQNEGDGFMESQSNYEENNPIINATHKLLAISGVKEAIDMVRRYAFKGAIEDAWVRQYISRLPDEDADKFTIDGSTIDYDMVDELLESLAPEAGPKIAELWNLSEDAGDKIAEIIYWGENALPEGAEAWLERESYLLPFVVVVNMKDPQATHALNEEESKFIRRNTIFVSRKGMMPGHIYLDMTYLPYNVLHMAYRSISLCRKCLGLQKQDLREGAPKTIDTTKALMCAEMVSAGKPSKEIARGLGFPIYSADNPSGNYPLFRKYLKRGQEIRANSSLSSSVTPHNLKGRAEENTFFTNSGIFRSFLVMDMMIG
jgi:hypothetical protein